MGSRSSYGLAKARRGYTLWMDAGHSGSEPRWYLDELAHAGPEHLDPTYVADYDRKAQVDPTAELAYLRGLGLGENSSLVDLGAGTGTLALAAAQVCRRVVAVDISPPMLAALRRAAEQLRLSNLECVHAGFLSYAHQGDPADFVYSRHALHQLPDFWKAVALRRIAAMLRPSGILRLRDLFLSCELDEVDAVVEAWLKGAAEHPNQGWTRPTATRASTPPTPAYARAPEERRRGCGAAMPGGHPLAANSACRNRPSDSSTTLRNT